MDIKELQDYRLTDAVKFHTHLNPRIWGRDEHLLPEVREKLLAIAADFKEFLGLDLEVKDITISGSNAAYTYTDHSDIDLHLVTDLPRADASDVYRELFDAKKYQYNDQHNFKIGGYDVELYVQNANQDPKSQGIYSVLDNKWISVPKRRKPEVDDISVKSKYEDLGRRIEAAIQSGDAAQLETLGKKVREFRQAGLDQTGEFGPENLAFKILRSNGTLDQLRAARLAAKDQELSIAEAGKKKKPFRYGFGGMFFPGYHYYGQTDAAVDGGSDGGESVKESVDNIQAQLEKFAAYCSGELGIENPPRIQLKRDPEWSKRNATFGRYMPEVNTLTLSVANRHPMDIMRTLAHELVHRRQDEIEPMPGHAGDTGSKWENQANAQAGVLMRDWGAKNPGMFDKKPLGEGTESNIDWVKPNFDYEWDEIEFQAKQPQVPADVRNYMAKYFPNKQAWMKSVQQGKSVVMPPNHGQKIRNYTDNKRDLLHALSPASHDPEGPAKEKRVNALFDKGGPIEMPIILKTSEGLWLIGGKTRLGTANLLKGIPAKVWLIGGQQVVAEVIKMPPTVNSSQGMADWAYQDAQDKKASSKGSLQGIPSEVYDMGDHLRVFVLDEQGPVLYLALEKFLDGFKSGAVAVEPRGRGKNLAVQVYQAVSDTFGLPIYSDTTQTDASRIGIWQKLMTSLPGRVVGYDQRSQEDLPLTATDQGPAVRSNQPVYTQRTAKDLSKPVTGQNRSRTRLLKLLPSQQVVTEASGYIPVTDAEAKDPRYSMAITQDIKPGENQRQAAKMGWKTNPAGTPPTARTNGLVEALTRKLQAVKEGLGFPLVSEQEQELAEVAMSPSALRAFVAGDVGQSMQAGFEAELIFTGIGSNEEEGEWEPDYSYDPRAYSLDNIEDFFNSGDFAEGMTRQTRAALEQDWMEWYDEALYDEFDAPVAVRDWILENDWDEEDLIERALDDEYSEDRVKEILAAMERRVNGTGTAADADLVEEYVGAEREVKRQLDERVELAIEEQNSDYESALDEFRENWDKDESDWLRDRGWRLMSDIAYNFDVTWPHLTVTGGSSEGGFNEDSAQQLADSLSEALGVKTTVSTGYHGARRDTSTWIFEPDGSLDADDDANMPVEIVSPPMPLPQTLEILPKFFEWAEDNGAYANSSTGFHMSVSMPDHENNVLDYTKLALFLGDEYVLKQFGREANTYAKSALQKIREKKGNVKAEQVLATMRRHLDQFASRALASPSGFGKYTSINPKNNYIEFRSAGGSNYFEDMDKIQNTLMRYARAMNIAMDPAADKPEYAKKLYKMLTDVKTQQTTDPKTGTQRTEVVPGKDNDAIAIFSRYVAGELPKSALKSFLKQIQYGREVAKNQSKEKIQWQVFQLRGSGSIMVIATSAEEAIKIAKQEYRDTTNPDDAYRAVPVLISPSEVPATQTPATDQMTVPAADDPRGNYVLRQREGNEGTGAVLHRFSAPNNTAAIEASRQWTTARGLERRSVWLDHISGVPPEVLNARPAQATRSSSIPEVPIDIAQNFSPIETEPQNFPAARQTGGEFSGEWKVVDGLNREVYRFGGVGNSQSDANRVAREWAQSTGFDGNLEVYPVMR